MRIEGVESTLLTPAERDQLKALLKARRQLLKSERVHFGLQLRLLDGEVDGGEVEVYLFETLQPLRRAVGTLHTDFGSVRLKYANKFRKATITDGTTKATPAEEPLDIEGIVAETVSDIVDEGRELVRGLVAIGRGVRGVTGGKRRRRSRNSAR
jgi:hypothetical protein